MNTAQLKTELQSLLQDIEDRERQIALFEKYGVVPNEPNYAYVFNFKFGSVSNTPLAAPLSLPFQQQTVQVKKDTIFYCKSFTHALTLTGTSTGAVAQAARITVPETVRRFILDYRFKINDTGSDREWQNDWVPGALLLTGNYNGFRLRKGHALCSPGSEVNIQIAPVLLGNIPSIVGVTDIQSMSLQIVMHGFEKSYKESA